VSVRDHFAAIEAFLHDQGVTNVFDAEVEEIPTGGYVVVYLSDPLRQMHRMPRRHEKYRFELMVRCVGRDARQARWISDRVNRLTDHVLAVPGWDCRRVEPLYAGHPSRDDDLTAAVVEIVSGYGYDAFVA
jgi:hypothetical protein